MQKDKIIEAMAKAICDNHPRKSTNWNEVVRLSKRDGYLVAKNYVEETRIQARAALEALQEELPTPNQQDPDSDLSAASFYYKFKNLKR